MLSWFVPIVLSCVLFTPGLSWADSLTLNQGFVMSETNGVIDTPMNGDAS